MRARHMGIIKEDSIMELGRVVFSLFIFVIRWFVSCHGQRTAFAPAVMNGPVVSSAPFLRSSCLEVHFHLVSRLGINVVKEHE